MHLVLVLAMATAAGWWLGSRPAFGPTARRWGHPVMLAAIGVLLFGMGVSLGSRPEIISQMGTLGLRAVSLSLAGGVSALLAVGVARRLWRKRP